LNFLNLCWHYQLRETNCLFLFLLPTYGRNNEGMLKKLKLYKFSERIIISPVEESERVKEYLDSWSIKYLEFPVLIPARIIESEVFKDK